LAVLFVVLGDVVNALPVDTGNPNLLTGSDERGQGSNVGGDLETAAQYYGGYGYGAYGPHYGYGGHYYGHGPHYGIKINFLINIKEKNIILSSLDS